MSEVELNNYKSQGHSQALSWKLHITSNKLYFLVDQSFFFLVENNLS